MTARLLTTDLDPHADTTGEHRERPARPGEFCDYCPRRAFVVYLTDTGPVGWCGRPETPREEPS